MMKTLKTTLVGILLLAPATSAQESPLGLIPETAGAVIRIQAPEKIQKDLSAFINKVQPGFGGSVDAQFRDVLGRMVNNPSLDGLDLSNDWYIALMIDDVGQPQPVFVLPTTDFEKASKAMDAELEIAENKSWLICTPDAALLADFGDEDLESIDSAFDEKSTAMLMAGHIGIGVNAEQLKDNFADDLESAEEHLDDAIESMVRQVQQASPGTDMKAVFGIYREIGTAFLQAVRDSESAAVSIAFTEEAFQVDMLLAMTEGTQTAKFLATQPVSSLDRLTSVPEGMLAYMAMHGDPKAMIDMTEKMMSGMLKDTAQKEKIAKSLEMMRTVKFGTLAGGGTLTPDEDGAMRYMAVSEMSPASAMQEAMKSMGDSAEYEIGGVRQTQSYEADAEQLDGQSVGIFRLKQTLPAGLDPTGMQEAMNKKFYGPDGIVQRILVKDDVVYQSMGGGLDALKQLTTSKTWTDDTLLKARARQHEKANAVVLVDMPNSLYQMARTIISTNALPLPIKAEQLDGLELAPSYAGFSMAAGENSLEARGCISVEGFQSFVRLATFIQGQMNQRQRQ